MTTPSTTDDARLQPAVAAESRFPRIRFVLSKWSL
jgi:hypothetical protein